LFEISYEQLVTQYFNLYSLSLQIFFTSYAN
jgi:hypothetical protein